MSSTLPAGPDIPAGVYYVACVEYRDRVAGLSKDSPTGPVIGFHNLKGSNQKWTFHPHHDARYRNWKISTKSSKGVVCYAHSNGTEGDIVFCKTEESQGTLYGIESATGGLYRISAAGPGGTKLFWTLSSEAEETQIKTVNGKAGKGKNQYWSFTLAKA